MQPSVLEYDSTPRPATFTWRGILRFVLCASPLVAAEAACAHLAYYTIGDVTSGLYWMTVLFGNLIIFPIAFASRRMATVALLLLALLIIPYQCFLGIRWWRVDREARRIVDYVVATHAASGQYPRDLRGYEFRDGGTADFFHYYVGGASPAMLGYHIATRDTSHWWTPDFGWQYCDD
jgi:hypothetical protein